MKPHSSRDKEKIDVAREAPDLAPDLLQIEDSEERMKSSEAVIQDRLIRNMNFDERMPRDLRLEGCVLQDVSLARNKLHRLKLRDVRFSNCNLANLEISTLSAVRVEFMNCRLTGLQAAETDCRHVLISESDARYLQLREGVFRSTEFDRCNLSESDFQGSDLRGTVLRNCNLEQVELTGAKLEAADLRGSRWERLRINPGDLRGVVVDPSQAMTLAALMGLRIRQGSLLLLQRTDCSRIYRIRQMTRSRVYRACPATSVANSECIAKYGFEFCDEFFCASR